MSVPSGQHPDTQVREHREAGAEVRVVAREVLGSVEQDAGRLRRQHHDVGLRGPRLDDASVVAAEGRGHELRVATISGQVTNLYVKVALWVSS